VRDVIELVQVSSSRHEPSSESERNHPGLAKPRPPLLGKEGSLALRFVRTDWNEK
jgi:hypothetical protein